jgi:hypothetical protein
MCRKTFLVLCKDTDTFEQSLHRFRLSCTIVSFVELILSHRFPLRFYLKHGLKEKCFFLFPDLDHTADVQYVNFAEFDNVYAIQILF